MLVLNFAGMLGVYINTATHRQETYFLISFREVNDRHDAWTDILCSNRLADINFRSGN